MCFNNGSKLLLIFFFYLGALKNHPVVPSSIRPRSCEPVSPLFKARLLLQTFLCELQMSNPISDDRPLGKFRALWGVVGKTER